MEKYAFGGTLVSGGRFCVDEFVRKVASGALKTFSHLIYFLKKFNKFRSLKVIYKGNAALKRITVQHEKIHSRQFRRVILHRFFHVILSATL